MRQRVKQSGKASPEPQLTNFDFLLSLMLTPYYPGPDLKSKSKRFEFLSLVLHILSSFSSSDDLSCRSGVRWPAGNSYHAPCSCRLPNVHPTFPFRNRTRANFLRSLHPKDHGSCNPSYPHKVWTRSPRSSGVYSWPWVISKLHRYVNRHHCLAALSHSSRECSSKCYGYLELFT